MKALPVLTRNLLGSCVILATLSACTGGSEDSSPEPTREQPTRTASSSPAVAADQLTGDWGAEPRLVDGAEEPWIQSKTDGSLDGFDGCSRVAGRWTVDTAKNTVTARKTAVVGVACPPAQEASFTSMTVEADRLTYKVGSGDIRSMDRRF